MTPTGVILLFTTGDPGGIQTHDLQNRNLMLYSAKLQGLCKCGCEDSNNLQRNNCLFDKKEQKERNNRNSSCLSTFY